MNNYAAYNLIIQSEITFPELLPAGGNPQVTIRYQDIGVPWETNADGSRTFRNTPSELLLTWNGIVRFLLTPSHEILVEPAPHVEEPMVRHLILGPVLGVLLYKMGMSVFHASAVTLPWGGAAFLARKGHGKSTLAAALVQRGGRLISDDLLVSTSHAPQVEAVPGISQLKLWPAALVAMGKDPNLFPKIYPTIEKRSFRVVERAEKQPVEVRALFLLDTGDEIEVLELLPKEALNRVMPHWYGMMFQGELLPFFDLRRHLEECIHLVSSTPVYMLKRPVSLELLPQICQAIECHVPAFA